MYYAFQTEDTLYIIMDYLSGGDLRYMICHRNYFTEEEIKFISACITLNLIYIHGNNIIHRDLKPENLVFDSDGYLHLTDFGIALEYHRGNIGVRNASGTPGYMGPEAINNKPHDFSTDYFALGFIVYGLMMRERLYQGNNRKEIREQMLNLEIKLDKDDLPDDWKDENVIDFINKLLIRKKKKRLGYKNDIEVKNHPWFNDVIFSEIENMTLNSPFVFDKEDNFDDSYAQMQENDSIYEGNKELFILEVNDSMTFKDFYFNIEDLNANEKGDEKDNKDKNKTKTNFTSKTSNYKKSGGDSSIVIHSFRNNKEKRKTAKFEAIQPNEDNKVVNIIRKGSRTGSMKLNLNKVE